MLYERVRIGNRVYRRQKNLKDQNSVSIQNREIRFTTSKIYQNIDIEFENVLSLGIDMPIQLTAYLGDGTGENMPWNKVLISNNTFQFENGKFKATDYGKDIITVKHTIRPMV